jgi:precorrin-6Y C5,15-methyltransferase (decarboxylating)
MRDDRTWLAVLGIGEDGVEGLSASARGLLARAAAVFGGARHLALAAPLIRGEAIAWPERLKTAIPAILARRGEPVAVLVSGDPLWFSLGSLLAEQVPMAEMEIVPAPSAFSLACARLGWPLQQVTTISLCGRPLAALIPQLQPRRRLLALSADGTTPGRIAALLGARGFGASRMHVLEALGGPGARVRETTASAFAFDDIGPLNLVALELAPAPGAVVIPRAAGLADERFAHDGQISKRELRALALSALAPRRGERLWDIGAGAGSVAIEWLLADPANTAIAIEADPARAARIRLNAENLGVPGIEVVVGVAPAALAGLARPDAVFIGGGARSEGVIAAAFSALAPGGRLVAHAVAIETESALMAARVVFGGRMSRIGIERLEPLGRLHGFRPAMTVTQWVVEKP